MLKKWLAALVLSFAAAAVAASEDIAVVYLGADDCRFCQHWEARAKGELLTSPEARAFKYFEVKGETLREPIVERHFPPELRWLSKKIGPSRGVPRFLLLVNGELTLSTYGTNNYAAIFLPALRQAVARRANKT